MGSRGHTVFTQLLDIRIMNTTVVFLIATKLAVCIGLIVGVPKWRAHRLQIRADEKRRSAELASHL